MSPPNAPKSQKYTLSCRLLVVYLLIFGWSSAVLSRLFYLQLFKGEEFRLLARQQQFGFVELSPKRGDVLDRHLEELAISVRMESVFAHPKEVSNSLKAAQLLAPILEQNVQEVYEKLISERSFVYIVRKISPRQAEQIRALKLTGVYFHKESKRVYPGRELASHVLGFVGLDNEGLSGLEYLYNDLLKGKKGRINLRLDAKRQSYDRDPPAQQTEGNTIILNIDRSIQFSVEQILQKTVDSHQALNGVAIVMNPHNGEVLAMASYPSFNPNRFSDYEAEVRRNRAILDTYEPGSTFKIVALSAVLNERLAEPLEYVDCRVGTLRLGNKIYREGEHGYDSLTFNEVLAQSSNVGTIKLALRLGEEKFYHYIKRYGFGEKTGIQLPGEQTGLLRPPSQWSKISIGALAIGQEVGVTPLQMVQAMAVLANGGYRISPRLVRKILTPQGDVIYEPEQKRTRILGRKTVLQMKKALALAIEQGTGKNARLGGYSSAGKTGTAQKFIDGSYSNTQFTASFAGFAPLENPALVTIIVIDAPNKQYYGGVVAAPVFKYIMERSLIHLRVPQDQPSRLKPLGLAQSSRELVDFEDSSMTQEEPDLERLEQTVLTLRGQETSVQGPKRIVVAHTGLFMLPDFSGLSLREVSQQSARLRLRLKISGSGAVVGQRPPAGTQVYEDAVCEVFFLTHGKKVNASSQVTLKNIDRTENRIYR